MKNIEVIKLEDEKEYAVVDEIEDNSNTYVYLTNIEDPEDFCIRKKVLENAEEFLVGLENDNEFEQALLYFTKKHVKE